VRQPGEDAVRNRPQRGVDEEQAIHLAIEAIAFRAVGQHLGLFVERVPRGQVEARVVGLAFTDAIEDLVEGVGVRIAGDPAEVPDHELPGARILQLLRPLVFLELGSHANAVHPLAP